MVKRFQTGKIGFIFFGNLDSSSVVYLVENCSLISKKCWFFAGIFLIWKLKINTSNHRSNALIIRICLLKFLYQRIFPGKIATKLLSTKFLSRKLCPKSTQKKKAKTKSIKPKMLKTQKYKLNLSQLAL